MGEEGMTEEYRRLSEHPEQIMAMDNETLLRHFLHTRNYIEINDNPLSPYMPTNALRMSFVFEVGKIESIEVLRRMKDGHNGVN